MSVAALGGSSGIRTHDSRIESPGSFRRIGSPTGSGAASGYAKWSGTRPSEPDDLPEKQEAAPRRPSLRMRCDVG